MLRLSTINRTIYTHNRIIRKCQREADTYQFFPLFCLNISIWCLNSEQIPMTSFTTASGISFHSFFEFVFRKSSIEKKPLKNMQMKCDSICYAEPNSQFPIACETKRSEKIDFFSWFEWHIYRQTAIPYETFISMQILWLLLLPFSTCQFEY